MKVHLGETKILLLQGIRDTGDLAREQRPKIAAFAADLQPDIIGMHYGSHFHTPELGRVHPDAHLRLRGPVHHLGHLHRSGGNRRWQGVGRKI